MRGVRLALGVMLWLLVLAVSTIPVATGAAGNLRAVFSWLSNGIVIQATMLVASLMLIAGLSRGRLSRYGFRTATPAEIRRTFIWGAVAAVAVQGVLAGLSGVFPRLGDHPAVAGSSFLQIVITVWVIASTCEEVLHRGLIQSFLEPLRGWGVTALGVRLSLPVVTAAVLFGAIHIMLLTTGANGAFVGGVVGAAVVLGLVAGYFREKTGSLLPAILVHVLFNVAGWVSDSVRGLVMP